MNNRIIKVIRTFTLSFLVSLPAFSQRFTGPPGGEGSGQGFFTIGWSEDGRRFAYGWFEITQMISNGSQMVIKVQNLVNDEILFQRYKTWDEGNEGPANLQYYPKSADKAWENIVDEIQPALLEYSIKEKKNPVYDFPLVGQDEINIKISELPGKLGYKVIALSREHGQKTIYSTGDRFDEDIKVVGGTINPVINRMAVVMQEFGSPPYSHYWVIGCHLTAGFDPMYEFVALPEFEIMSFAAFVYGVTGTFNLNKDGTFGAFGDENVGELDYGTWEYDEMKQEVIITGNSDVYRWKMMDENHIQVPTQHPGLFDTVEVHYYLPK